MNAGRVAELRPASPADLDAIERLAGAAFARPWSAATFREEIARSDRVWLVADLADRVVAFGGVADLAGDAHVLTVAVDEGHRRRGLARGLVTALLGAARERFRARRATLEVRESNVAARALYRGLGFTEAGVRPGYYQDDGEGAVVLWCEDLDAALGAAAVTPPRPTTHRRPKDPTP